MNLNKIRSNFFLFVSVFLIFAGCQNEKNFESWKDPVTGIEFILIPKGHFVMGPDSAQTIQQVTISHDFWIGRTEITRKQWQKIMGTVELHPEKPSPFSGSDSRYPMVSISYSDVQHFLDKLNKISPEHYFRLPTEAEWEYACRSGTTTPFAFGSQISDTLVNYNAEIPSSYSESGINTGHPLPVGSFRPNAFGLYDMHGNVWEWVSDWYAPYSSEETSDPEGPKTGKLKIIRGGSWYFGADQVMSSTRRSHAPELWGFSTGFRIVAEKKK